MFIFVLGEFGHHSNHISETIYLGYLLLEPFLQVSLEVILGVFYKSVIGDFIFQNFLDCLRRDAVKANIKDKWLAHLMKIEGVIMNCLEVKLFIDFISKNRNTLGQRKVKLVFGHHDSLTDRRDGTCAVEKNIIDDNV